MLTVTRCFEFDSAHRVLGHEGKCRFLHGHRYKAVITVSSWEGLDGLGRIVDYAVLKEVVGKWIDDNWDHSCLLHRDDILSDLLVSKLERAPFLMKYGNPTAENIARELYDVATNLLTPYNLKIVNVRIWETPNCWADFIAE